jgi:hypothetical protein
MNVMNELNPHFEINILNHFNPKDSLIHISHIFYLFGIIFF